MCSFTPISSIPWLCIAGQADLVDVCVWCACVCARLCVEKITSWAICFQLVSGSAYLSRSVIGGMGHLSHCWLCDW